MLRIMAVGACLLACACASHEKPVALSAADAVVAYQFCVGAEAANGPRAAEAACKSERAAMAAPTAPLFLLAAAR